MTLIATRRIHSGRVIELDVDTVRFPDGSTGEMEMIRHSGAAAVVPILSDPAGADPAILLIRQFRHATDGVLWEIPAGRLAPGETPEVCARRELLEETGMRADRIEPLTVIWTTPGFTDERIHLFSASGLTEGMPAREPDEFIELVPRPLSQVLTGIQDGEICDAKTVAAILIYGGIPAGTVAWGCPLSGTWYGTGYRNPLVNQLLMLEHARYTSCRQFEEGEPS